MQQARDQSKRRGYVLVLFVMMFVGLMGLAALVIDMGLRGSPNARCNPPWIPRRWKGCARAASSATPR